MADNITLIAQRRELTGKKVRQLRRQGIIPGNIYGRGLESVPVQIAVRALRDVLISAGTTTVVDVHLRSSDGSEDGKQHPVLIEHITRNPATGQVLHVDLHQVDLNRPVHAAVPITLVGEAPAVARDGGVLLHTLDTIEVEALPRSLPHEIEVDISVLREIDSQLTVADLRLPAGVTVASDPAMLVVKVMASKMEQEVAAEEAETAAEAKEAAEGEAPAGESSGEEGGARGEES